MKKTLVLLVSVLFVLGTVGSAFAIHAEIPSETAAVIAKGATQITLSGQLRLRARSNNNFDVNDDASDQQNYYHNRLRLGTHVKVSDMAEAMIQLEAETDGGAENMGWGSNNSHMGGGIGILQGWLLIKGDIAGGAGLKVGHMPLALGYKTFFDHTLYGDDAILAYINPTPEAHVAGLIIKFDEGSVSDNTDDLDGYVLLGTFKLPAGITLGGNWTFINQSDSRMQLHNLEAHADGKMGMVGFKASVDFQFGDINDTLSAAGYAAYGKVTADLGAAKVRGVLAYGSGDDNNDDDVDTFQSFLSPVVYTTFVEDYRMGGNTSTGISMGGRGISNNLYVGGGASADVSDKISVDGDVWYVALAEDNASGESDIGFEIDAKATYKVTTNVKAWIHAGYLVAGDALGDDADNPWATQGGLIVSW